MKRLSIVGLMLASAFALTNCSQEIVPPIQENDVIVDESIKEDTTPEEVVSIPFEVYANPSAETRTAHDSENNGTKWSANDTINVYHSVHNRNSYKNNHAFIIADVEKGLFGGGLAEPLASGTYDWCFLYPYDKSRGNTLTAATVKIGTDEQGNFIQTQYQSDSKSHIAGAGYPMFGSTKADYPNGIPAGENPKVRMKHLSALVAVKLVNETGNDITINHIELEAANHPIVGKFNVDLTKSTPAFSVTPDGDDKKENDEYSNSAVLKLGAEGIVINKADGNNESSSKFYMAIAPVTDKFTIRINGTAITNDIEIPLESGKVTTLKVKIPKLLGKQSLNTIKGGVNFTEWTNKSEDEVIINGQSGIQIYTVKDGIITIKGTLKQFLGESSSDSALPLSFYAASKTECINNRLINHKASLSIHQINVNVNAYGYEVPLEFDGAALALKMGGSIPTSFDLPAIGDFNSKKLIILNETDSYYYINESKANVLIGMISEGYKIQDMRDLAIHNSQAAWEKFRDFANEIAPTQMSGTLGTLVNILVGIRTTGRKIAKVPQQIQNTEIIIQLKTTGEAVCWGLNVHSDSYNPNADIYPN